MSNNEMDRRELLKCMAWVGTGAAWTLAGGVLKGVPLGQAAGGGPMDATRRDDALHFAQISDTHPGFHGGANPDATATLRETTAKIKAERTPPASSLSVPIFFVPGEHDVLDVTAGGICSGSVRARAGPGGTASITAVCTSWDSSTS